MVNVFFHICFWSLLCLPYIGDVIGFAAEKKINRAADISTINIQSDFLEADTKKRLIEFYGNVNAKTEDFELTCERLWIHPKAKAQGSEKDWEIEKVVAQGKVVIRRSTGEVIEAEKAVYNLGNGLIEITGNPILTKGPDSIKGQRIEVYVKENKVKVLSGGTEKVTAVVRSIAKPNEVRGGE